MNREKNLMMYGFVSVLLLASFLMTVPANQYQKIFAQTEGEAPDVNVTEDIQENATDTETPPFENQNATFTPPPEGEREAPPVPANAIKGDDLPKETITKDPDSEPLSVTNRTELLEVLPSNSTKIIEHVNEDLKNSTGEGLLPPAILDKIISGEGQGNDTILDISTPEELDEIKNFSEVATNQTTEEALEEGEPISNATNATDTETLSEEQDGEEQEQAQAGAETNMTNATGGGEEQQQEQDEEDTEDGEEQEQAQAGEAVNLTNATSGEMTNMTNATGRGEEQQQEQDEEDTEDGEEQEQAQASAGQQDEEDTEDGEEQEQEQAVTNATNATAPQPPAGMLNTTNVTSMLNATGLQDETENSEDSPEDESEDE
ncbi:MAG TPA: hypothetical protein VFY55_05310 [Nitrososphaeraceae archaeon]|nr:hypothetical protein [Nitrososphaeraceae archaeon]